MIMLAWFGLLVAGSHARSQDANSLSLNLATNLAIDNSPEVRQVKWKIEQALAEGIQNSRLVNPQVGALANEIGNDGSAGQYGFFIQRNLVRNERVGQIQNAFEWKANGFRAQSKILQRKIAREIARLFIEIEFQRNYKTLLEKKKLEFDNIKKTTEALTKGGGLSELDTTKVEVEIAKIVQSIELLELDIPSRTKLLQSYTGDESEFELDFDFFEEVTIVLASSLEREVDVEQNPMVEMVSNRIESQKWQVQVALSRQRPDWQLQTSLNYDFDSDDFFGGFQMNVPWQLNDRKQGLFASQKAQVEFLLEERRRVVKRLERRIIELNRQRIALVAQLRSINKSILPRIDDYTKKLTKLFHAGEMDFRSVNLAILESFQWREKRLSLAKDLLLIEAETETLIVE